MSSEIVNFTLIMIFLKFREMMRLDYQKHIAP